MPKNKKLGISLSVQSLNFGPPCPVWRTLSRGYLYFQQLANFSLETYINAQRDATNDIAVEAPREEEQAELEPRVTATNNIEAPREEPVIEDFEPEPALEIPLI